MNESEQLRRVTKWLRRKLRLEMLLQGLMALAAGALASVILGAVAGLLAALIFASMAESFQEAVRTGFGVSPGGSLIFSATFLAVFLLAILMAHRIRQRMTYAGQYHSPRHLDRHFFDAAGDIGGEIFLAGPHLLARAGESLAKLGRLSRVGVPEAASIILWLWRTGHKASAAEIAAAFPNINVVSVLPQFRDIPGIIWLLPRRGVVLLSSELREELSAFLGKPRAAPPRPEPEPEPGPRDFDPQPEHPNYRPELLHWYAALGLPAFASIHDVKKRYRQLAKKYHPDAAVGRGGLRTVQSDEAMKRINLAYSEILKSANHR